MILHLPNDTNVVSYHLYNPSTKPSTLPAIPCKQHYKPFRVCSRSSAHIERNLVLAYMIQGVRVP